MARVVARSSVAHGAWRLVQAAIPLALLLSLAAGLGLFRDPDPDPVHPAPQVDRTIPVAAPAPALADSRSPLPAPQPPGSMQPVVAPPTLARDARPLAPVAPPAPLRSGDVQRDPVGGLVLLRLREGANLPGAATLLAPGASPAATPLPRDPGAAATDARPLAPGTASWPTLATDQADGALPRPLSPGSQGAPIAR